MNAKLVWLAFAVSSVLAAAALGAEPARVEGVTTRVSVSSDGAQANESSIQPKISSDGRLVAFTSGALNLVAGSKAGRSQVFVHNRRNARTTLVSVGRDGRPAKGDSGSPSISPGGRFVAFYSEVPNPHDTTELIHIFVRDRYARTTRQVSVGTKGREPNLSSEDPSVSGKSRYVAFGSDATNLVPNDTNIESDIFVRELRRGATTRVSVGPDRRQSSDPSFNPSISADGRFVTFQSFATDLDSATGTAGIDNIFLHDRRTGRTSLVSVGLGGQPPNGFSELPSISADGRFVAFQSNASNLVLGDSNSNYDAFVRDLRTARTFRVSVGPRGRQANDFSGVPSISADGRFVTFQSFATDLVPGDTNSVQDIFVHSRESGATIRVSVGRGGRQANASSWDPSISADGRVVAFMSSATNLVPGDTNGEEDIFVHELAPPAALVATARAE